MLKRDHVPPSLSHHPDGYTVFLSAYFSNLKWGILESAAVFGLVYSDPPLTIGVYVLSDD
ncbi:hypothetical protein [Shewanella sp. 6_MG-2023]|uniref:hypothetical protein n=1 Tax=Shewanella sp. 6_MG-2023 TaxID=3062660 RepID=UPI0026E44638|nr:hypothetical protein [Shewanella sp. 6_MG-2023]MDO6618914.1 hypothetical protein [Shewanella sp. 6_MG-2023]